jgi:integrase
MAAPLVKTKTPGIYKRGSRYAVLYRDSEGRQRQESAGTLDEARRLKAARTAAVATGEFHAASRIKFREYGQEWVERYGGRGRRGFREVTRDDYRRDLRRFVVPYFDGKLRRRVEQITPRDVANFVAWLCDEQEQGRRAAIEKRAARAEKDGVGETTLPLEAEPRYLADATVRRILAPLRACMASAVAEGVIRMNPTNGVALPVRDEQRAIEAGTDADDETVKALTTEQLDAFMRVCPTRWLTFFEVLAATGLRWSEIIALRWRDITLDGSEPRLRVRRAFVAGRYGPPKSRHGKRAVPLDHSLVLALRAARRDSEWPGDDDLVFPSNAGTPLDYSNTLRRVLRPAAEEAGAPWVAFHTFRHTCATRLFATGRNAVQVSRWLGHHSATFTISVYVHLLDGDLGAPLQAVTIAEGRPMASGKLLIG